MLDVGVAFHDLGSALIAATAVHVLYGGLRLRFFGPRNLIEDRSQRSDATTLVYLQLGYRFNAHWEANFDVFNLLDSRDSDIDYYYTSRLA